MNVNVVYLVQHTDNITQGILIVLATMSIACTGLFIYKLLSFMYTLRVLKTTHNKLIGIKTIQNFVVLLNTSQQSLPYYILQRCTYNIPYHPPHAFLVCSIQHTDLQIFDTTLERVLDEVIYQESRWLGFLFACAALAPLIGLLGTVWGLINAFMNISNHQSSSITVIAPGVAEALITTLAGLILAIASLGMYHILMSVYQTIEYHVTHYIFQIHRTVHSIFSPQAQR